MAPVSGACVVEVLLFILLTASKSDHSLRRQLEAIASLKMNAAELHQSNAVLSPAVNEPIVIKCPLILVHFKKRFSTSGVLQKGKVKGDSGNRKSDVGADKHGSSLVCPSCGHPCSRTEIFMCR